MAKGEPSNDLQRGQQLARHDKAAAEASKPSRSAQSKYVDPLDDLLGPSDDQVIPGG